MAGWAARQAWDAAEREHLEPPDDPHCDRASEEECEQCGAADCGERMDAEDD